MNTEQNNNIVETVPNKIIGYKASILVANGGGGIQSNGKTLEEALMNMWNNLSYNITTRKYACPYKSLAVINESGDAIWHEDFDKYPKNRPVGCGVVWNGCRYSTPCFLAIPIGQKFAKIEVSKVMHEYSTHRDHYNEIKKTVSKLPESSFLWVKETDCWIPVGNIDLKQWCYLW